MCLRFEQEISSKACIVISNLTSTYIAFCEEQIQTDKEFMRKATQASHTISRTLKSKYHDL